MPNRWIGPAALAGTLAVLVGLAAIADPGAETGASTPTETTTPPIPDGAPAEYVAHPGDWVLPGRDYDNSRAAGPSTITAANVDALDVVWEAELEGGDALSTVPLIVGDTIYLQSGAGVISSIDRATGTTNWTSKAYGFNIGPFGVAVADGLVFGMHGSTGVVALDADTGTQQWFRTITPNSTTGVDIQPTVYAGLVFASTVPVSTGGIYTGGDRGVVFALDARTGAVRWTFDTVPETLWGNAAVNSGGGAWYPPAIDAKRGLVLVGVANPAPFPGTQAFPNAASRPGPNLYTDSAVALDATTGELEWFHQVTPHDLFDRDQVHTLIARPEGGEVVISAGKSGVVVGLDPADGHARWTTEVGTHDNDDLGALTGPTVVFPGTFGGILTPPATADGIVYFPTVNAPSTLRPDATAYFASDMGTNDGEVVAIDAETGEVVWATDVPGDPLGGTAVVNDLVLTALLDGTVLALDRATGDLLWDHDVDGTINGWMSIAGDLVVVPVASDPSRLVAFRLPQ